MVGLEEGEGIIFLPKDLYTISIRGVDPINYDHDDAAYDDDDDDDHDFGDDDDDDHVYSSSPKHDRHQGAVMSTNIQIFEYSNKMALEYYSYSCHFPSANIFGYSFVDFWTTKYIRIFVHKFSKIRLYLNICSEPYFNIQLSILMKKVNLDKIYVYKNIQCKILFRGNSSECF